MMAMKRSDGVMPNDSSAAEHVGQIGAFVRFILLVRTVSWAIACDAWSPHTREAKNEYDT